MNQAKKLTTQAFKAVELSGSSLLSHEGNHSQIKLYLERDYHKFHVILTYGTDTSDMVLDIAQAWGIVKNNIRSEALTIAKAKGRVSA